MQCQHGQKGAAAHEERSHLSSHEEPFYNLSSSTLRRTRVNDAQQCMKWPDYFVADLPNLLL
jgi:hypothetical protein